MADDASLLRRDKLVAWCIVPFDAKKRGPAERAAMLKELGVTRCAYDWRDEHVSTFEQEILEYKKNGIEFFAFWSVHEEAFKLFEKYEIHPQIWQIVNAPVGDTQAAKVESAIQQMLELAKRTKAMGCKLGLYNHGGWSGEPENMVAVCKGLHDRGYDHVGIVYNLHHGHGHINDWVESFAMMKPFLLCLNLNGMNPNEQPKILGIGKGAHELDMIRIVVKSDYSAPIGIIDHREQIDARESLLENLEGLEWIRKEIDNPGSGGLKPTAMVAPMMDDKELVAGLVSDTLKHGDAMRGARVFADMKLACLSCHRVGEVGGTVGQELTSIAKDRTLSHIVESVLWPKRDVKPEFVSWTILTIDGRVLTGYKQTSDAEKLTLRDPASGKLVSVLREEIEEEVAGSTVMPSGLLAAMSKQQQLDLFRFLGELGRDGRPLPEDLQRAIAHSQMHGPADFPFSRNPIQPASWPNATHHVNRDRVYDFYSKQAEYFRTQHPVPMLLSPFRDLDGGNQGHWGNQNDEVWMDGRWNEAELGSVQSGVFRSQGMTIPRGVCVKLGEHGELSTCFNPDTLTYDAVWSGGFVSFEKYRHGFMNGLQMVGSTQPLPEQAKLNKPFRYRGFYRYGNRIIFSYMIDNVEFLDSPWTSEGKLVRDIAPVEEHPLRHVMSDGGPLQWPQNLKTSIERGTGRPYAVDTIELPYANPWKVPMFCGGHDFLPDGSVLVCTMQGDVWRVTGLNSRTDQDGIASWKRFASGLHHALGLIVSNGEIFVQGRDQLTRLKDLNNDGEADFYECFSNAFVTSPAGHDFVCGLQRDQQGNFYTASGNQGLVRISPDGQRAEVIATGFRNPDGLGILPDGSITVPVSEGDWTPSSAINLVRHADLTIPAEVPHFGYGGTKNGKPPELPLVYIPRGMDNSSAEQTFVNSELFGPLKDQLLHLSFGTGTWYVLLRDQIDGQMQGAIVPMAGDFLSGAHRARFSPNDGQMYVTGMAGWGSYTPDDGCFQRVRYTGDPVQVPTGFHTHQNGVRISFSETIDLSVASDVKQHFAQCWNYRYSGAYGSPEYSPTHPGVAGHDPLSITSAHVLNDSRSLFLEIPDLQPASVLQLRLHVNQADSLTCNPTGSGHDLFLTVHKLDQPYVDFPGFVPREKTLAAHPLLSDLALNSVQAPNPWRKKIASARKIEIETGKNLSYVTPEFSVKANEPIAFTLSNPDVVPHNWVLVKPNALQRVGERGNQLIADPSAYARHYVPETDEVIVYTDIVSPNEKQTIYFQAPSIAGRYPFLCTFPGHWMVMNGVMIVE